MKIEDLEPNENNDQMMLILFQLNKSKEIQKEFLKSLDELFNMGAEQED